MSPVASLVTTERCSNVSMCLRISTKCCLFPGIVPLLYSVGNKTCYYYINLMGGSHEFHVVRIFSIIILGISKEPVNLGKLMSGDLWKLPMCIEELPSSYLATFHPSHVVHVSSRHPMRA